LLPGDLIALFTDGISEAMNSADEEWDEESLIETLRSYRTKPVEDIMGILFAAADRFANGVPQHDDMTVVVLRVRDTEHQKAVP